jgi:hypothetical protein
MIPHVRKHGATVSLSFPQTRDTALSPSQRVPYPTRPRKNATFSSGVPAKG